MRLSDLVAALPADLAPRAVGRGGPDEDPVIRGLSYDSRAVSAGELFFALRPLEKIYDEALRKHIVQAKLEMEVIGRRLSPERILTFAPSYNGLVRRRLRAQWGKWTNW